MSDDTQHYMRKSLYTVEGVVIILITLGYIALTITSLIKWNEATSGALITGFAIFSQKAMGDFFQRLHQPKP